MAQWNDEYINPYAEHGKKSEQVKKITISGMAQVIHLASSALIGQYFKDFSRD